MLNDTQSRIVSENHNLIYWFIHKKHLDIDEWYGRLAIELCEAVIRHDATKGSLSTLFSLRANHMLANEFAKNDLIKNKHNGHISWDSYMVDNDGMTASCEDYDNALKVMMELSVDENIKNIVELKLKGYTQNEISDMLKISQSQISRKLINFREVYENEKID